MDISFILSKPISSSSGNEATKLGKCLPIVPSSKKLVGGSKLTWNSLLSLKKSNTPLEYFESSCRDKEEKLASPFHMKSLTLV